MDAAQPEEFAREFVTQLKLRQPFDMEGPLQALRLRLRKVDSIGFDGALVRLPERLGGTVAVRQGIVGKGRARFTIAHEIGHYVLPGHGRVFGSVCSNDQIEAWSNGPVGQEIDANRFAAELLLPSYEITPILKQRMLSMETAELVRVQYETSLTAAAFKCIDVTEEVCVLVTSVKGVVRNYRPSKSWRYIMHVKCELGSGTLAKQLVAGGSVRRKRGVVSALAWASGDKYMEFGAEVMEDSVRLGQSNIVLSLLTAIDPS